MPRTEKENQRIRDERQEQILTAAAKVFAINGFVGTRIDDIASEAGISKGLIYHYFGGKETIFNSLIERAALGTTYLFQQALKIPDNADGLSWLMGQVITGLTEQPYMFTAVFQAFVSDAVPTEARQLASDLSRKTSTILTQLIREGQKNGKIVKGDPEALAFILGSFIQGMATSVTMAEPLPSSSVIKSIISLYVPSVLFETEK